jgi:hypothetical protein
MTQLEANSIPWPGPRPYSEAEWRLFRGRGEEISRIGKRLQGNALTVLTGGSATGKTSLVRAGLVPELRNRRYHTKGTLAQWPVLVLRRWGAQSGTTVDQILMGQIEEAIQDIHRWGDMESQAAARDDAKEFEDAFSEIGRSDGERADAAEVLLELVARRAAKSVQQGTTATPQGLILVFDQFEELLRPGGEASASAVRIVRDLFRRGQDTVRVLLSLRQEYLYSLRDLEQIVGGLAGRSIVLEPIREATIIEALIEVSNRAGVSIDAGSAGRIVGWLKSKRDRAANETSIEGDPDEAARAGSSSAAPDLLRLQAVLWELFRFTLRTEKKNVTAKVLDDFIAENGNEVQLLVNGALERWIEAALRREIGGAPTGSAIGRDEEGSEYGKWSGVEGRELDEQVRRVAIRLGPNLTSLDYKVPQEENMLFRLAMGDDIWRLGMKDAAKKKDIRIIEGRPPELNWREIGLEDRSDIPSGIKDFVSGLAKRDRWSAAETGNRLVLCFREALDRLVRGNVLLRTLREAEGQRSVVWELVHDQFGPAFANWGRDFKDTWRDCENSWVMSSGVQPIILKENYLKGEDGEEGYRVSHLTWRGCTIEPVGKEMLVLEGAKFEDCILTGSIFRDCIFRGGEFSNCTMNGTLFVGCVFETDGQDLPLIFDRCLPSGLAIIGSRIAGLEFRACELVQPTIKDSIISGNVRFSNESRVVQGYFDVDRSVEGAYVIFEEGSQGFLCSGSEDTWGYVQLDKEGKMLSAPLPKGFLRNTDDSAVQESKGRK